MPALQDFTTARRDDGTLTISMAPPVAVGSWEVSFLVAKRFGSDTFLVQKHGASGFWNGQSGVTLANPLQGIFNVAIDAVDTSGLPFGNYAYDFGRVNSGSNLTLSEGYMLLSPSMGG